jgi:predicted nuclease of predicted toxin-antitoxin system
VRFLLDACVDVRVAGWLRENGHEVVHLREHGLQRLPNGEIFAKALSEQRCVITFDLDFGEIAAATGGRVGQVLVMRLRDTRWSRVVERLRAVLDDLRGPFGEAMIVTVEESRHRIRRLPIGRSVS